MLQNRAKDLVGFFQAMVNEDTSYISFTSKPTKDVMCPWIEVRPSTYGNGLFAKTDIKKDSVITFYPIHQLGRHIEGDEWKVQSHPDAKEVHTDYALCVNDNLTIYGDPSLTSNPMFLGHMSNDPAIDISEQDTIKFVIRYFIACKVRGNASFHRFDEPWVGIRATRDINKDEEILTPYSLPYWVKRRNEKMEDVDSLIKHYIETQPVQKAKFLVELMEEISKVFI